MSRPDISTLLDEGLGNCSYVVDLGDGRALVVDPEGDPRPYVADAERRGLRIALSAETHLHADFVSGSRELAARPAVLGAIKAPVAVLLGSDTKPFFTISARYVVDHVANARVHEIPVVGHAAPLTHPEALAEALTEFFAASPELPRSRHAAARSRASRVHLPRPATNQPALLAPRRKVDRPNSATPIPAANPTSS